MPENKGSKKIIAGPSSDFRHLMMQPDISSILNELVMPSLEQRRFEWANDIGQELNKLSQDKKIDIDELKKDQAFIDTILQATAYAIKTSEEEKKNAFKNVIINTALSEGRDETAKKIFLNLIDAFTAWHIKLLLLFDGPADWLVKNGQSLPYHFVGSLTKIIDYAFPEMHSHADLLDIIWSDLYRNGLVNTSSLRTTMTGGGMLEKRVTNLGEKFLMYISNVQ